jgi:AraC-like DNA-binding protein
LGSVTTVPGSSNDAKRGRQSRDRAGALSASRRIRGFGRERRRTLFEEALAVVELRAADPELSVDDIARRVFASRRQVQRSFAESGTTVRATVRRVRMAHAQHLLADYRLSVGEVGRLVGYVQPAEFARVFRGHYGCSPSEWRRDRARLR